MKIEFTKDFSVYKKGDQAEFTGPLAANLIRRKVAKKYAEKSKKKSKK